MAEREARQPWTDAVRDRAEQLAREPELSASDVRAALSEELGADVPLGTVGRWVRELRRAEPIDRAALLRRCADRAAVLVSEELSRMERQSPQSRDLARLDQTVRTLKNLTSVEVGKRGSSAQTLADLSKGAPSAETAEVPLSRAPLSAV